MTGPANSPDCRLAGDSLAAVEGAGLLVSGAVLRADKGYDYPEMDALVASCVLAARERRRKKKGDPTPELEELMGSRWALRRAHAACLTNFGQQWRVTGWFKVSRDAWLASAIALILVMTLGLRQTPQARVVTEALGLGRVPWMVLGGFG